MSLNTDKSAVLATAKGNKTTGGPDSAGMDVLGPFLDILQGVRTTGLSHIFLFFSFFTLSPSFLKLQTSQIWRRSPADKPVSTFNTVCDLPLFFFFLLFRFLTFHGKFHFCSFLSCFSLYSWVFVLIYLSPQDCNCFFYLILKKKKKKQKTPNMASSIFF